MAKVTKSDRDRIANINGSDYDYDAYSQSDASMLGQFLDAINPFDNRTWDQYWDQSDERKMNSYGSALQDFYGTGIDDLTDDQILAFNTIMDNYEVDKEQGLTGIGQFFNNFGYDKYNDAIGSQSSIGYLKDLMNDNGDFSDNLISSLASGDITMSDDLLATIGTGKYSTPDDAIDAYLSGAGERGTRGQSLFGGNNVKYNALTGDNNATLGLDAGRIGLDVLSLFGGPALGALKGARAAKSLSKLANSGDDIAIGLAKKFNPNRANQLKRAKDAENKAIKYSLDSEDATKFNSLADTRASKASEKANQVREETNEYLYRNPPARYNNRQDYLEDSEATMARQLEAERNAVRARSNADKEIAANNALADRYASKAVQAEKEAQNLRAMANSFPSGIKNSAKNIAAKLDYNNAKRAQKLTPLYIRNKPFATTRDIAGDFGQTLPYIGAAGLYGDVAANSIYDMI